MQIIYQKMLQMKERKIDNNHKKKNLKIKVMKDNHN